MLFDDLKTPTILINTHVLMKSEQNKIKYVVLMKHNKAVHLKHLTSLYFSVQIFIFIFKTFIFVFCLLTKITQKREAFEIRSLFKQRAKATWNRFCYDKKKKPV